MRPPVGTRPPATAESAPLAAIVKPEISSGVTFATYRCRPSGVAKMPYGWSPAAKGDPGNPDSAPLAAMLKPETLSDLKFAE